MSDLFSPDSPKTIDEDAEEGALQFARCSQNSAETEDRKKADKKTKSAAADALNEDLAMHRDHASTLPNLRRSHLTYRHLAVSFVISLGIGALVLGGGWWFYTNKIEPRLSGSGAPVAASASASAAAPAAATDEALKAELAQSAEQIAALQKQVDVMRREQLLTQQNTRESLENISATLKNPQLVPPAVTATASQPGVARMAEMKAEVSPTQQEFIQLKERNRLTQYADEAIATGMRAPLELLVQNMRDPQMEHLHYAAQAEYLRAVRAIQILQREDPGYHLPVAELFKDTNIRDEADVPPEQLLKLLADSKQPAEVRVRVCFLLLGSPLPETNAALIKAIKEDPSLDVAKHAQLALEQRIKKRFRIFDIPAIEEWFKSPEK
ncbi:hypothetical protein [Prosthecobacter sp.]|uniref:hypothetical protein n=1 Tax=Prosthecobacter sp. TaxID=1965333 RepID=UPI003784B9A5